MFPIALFKGRHMAKIHLALAASSLSLLAYPASAAVVPVDSIASDMAIMPAMVNGESHTPDFNGLDMEATLQRRGGGAHAGGARAGGGMRAPNGMQGMRPNMHRPNRPNMQYNRPNRPNHNYQNRPNRPNHSYNNRPNSSHYSHPNRPNGGYYNRPNGGHHGGWSQGWRNDARYNWRGYRNSNRHVYRPGRYYAPYSNYYYRPFSVGFYIGSPFYRSSYWITNPYNYRLPAAYGGYRWVRYYNDVLLVNTYNGYVADCIYGFFY